MKHPSGSYLQNSAYIQANPTSAWLKKRRLHQGPAYNDKRTTMITSMQENIMDKERERRKTLTSCKPIRYLLDDCFDFILSHFLRFLSQICPPTEVTTNKSLKENQRFFSAPSPLILGEEGKIPKQNKENHKKNSKTIQRRKEGHGTLGERKCDRNCHKMSDSVLYSALRKVYECTQATYQLLMRSCVSLGLPGGVRQAVGCVTQVGRADSGCTLSMGLPSCSEQRARNGTPKLGASGPLGKGEGDSLSDKELKTVINDAVEYGLCPWGSAAKYRKLS